MPIAPTFFKNTKNSVLDIMLSLFIKWVSLFVYFLKMEYVHNDSNVVYIFNWVMRIH